MILFFLPSKFRLGAYIVLGVTLLGTGTATLKLLRLRDGAAADVKLAWLQLGIAAIFLIPVALHFITEIGAGMFSSLFFSHHAPSKMPLRTSLPEGLAKKGYYPEALDVYAQLAQQHPDDAIPHLGRIRVAVQYLNDLELADQFYAEGMAKLESIDAQLTLTEQYDLLLSQLAPLHHHPTTPLHAPAGTAAPPAAPPPAS